MAETYDLFDELRMDMDAAGDTPQGRLAMAVLQLSARLSAIESVIEGCIELDHRGEPCGLKARKD
jgi:hypothetical protein